MVLLMVLMTMSGGMKLVVLGMADVGGIDGYRIWHVKCHGNVVSRRCLPAKVVQRHAIRQLSHWCARCSL
jgi:hypothetical protein